GSSMALKEQHFKRRLAYSTISNLSYMIFGAALMIPEGQVAAMSHFVFHGIMKIVLFMVAGAVIHMTEKNYVSDLFGFGKKMPVMFVCFTIASVAIVGVPPTVGFISKWNLLSAGAISGTFGFIGVGVLLISSLLTAMYLFSIVIKAFFPGPGFDPESVKDVKDPNMLMKFPIVLITALVLFGVAFSRPFMSFLENIASGLI
ncbi:MAG: proton-conducting membrane transporter, partial [Lachnospiraceae bacterium]|nr:proton-conducting membrane transporter [Lachnospiraceae bacterium]